MKIPTLIRNAFCGVAIFSAAGLSAQDIHFSQFYQSPLTLNPALAGTTVWIRAGAIYRSQWGSIHDQGVSPTPYSTIGAAFDMKPKRRWIKLKNATEKYRQSGDNGFGWGVNFYNDRAGDGQMNTLQANASLAYQIMVGGKSMLALGFQGGMMQRGINWNGLYWGTEYDPTQPGGYLKGSHPDKAIAGGTNNFIVPDVSTGMIYTFKKNERYMRGGDQMEFTVGASLFHVNQPKYSFLNKDDKLDMRTVFHGTGIFGISNTSIAVVPGYMIAFQGANVVGPNKEIYVGSMFRYMLREDSKYTGFVKGASISAGGYYRNKDAFIATALFEFSVYAVGVSYDVNVSGLKTASKGRGGLEITLRFLNPAPFLYSQASFSK